MTLRARSFAAAVALLAFTLAGSSALAQTRTLYDRLGGYPAISAVVDDFVKNVAADKRINRFFANANIDRLRRVSSSKSAREPAAPASIPAAT